MFIMLSLLLNLLEHVYTLIKTIFKFLPRVNLEFKKKKIHLIPLTLDLRQVVQSCTLQ